MFRSIFVVSIVVLLGITSADAGPELMNKLVQQYKEVTKHRLSEFGNCTNGNIVQRKEW